MAELVRCSEAAALALHLMALLAREEGPLSAKDLSQKLQASEAHVAKVLHTLTKEGLLRAKRGPKGGYVLAKPKGEISLLSIYEALEGPLRQDRCVFPHPVCPGDRCVFAGIAAKFRKELVHYLSSTTLADLASSG